MTARLVAETIGALLFLFYVGRGREQEVLRRCVACGCRHGEKHHRDCHYKDRM